MSYFEPDSSFDENADMNDEITREIERCRQLVEEGGIYN